jgi:hypothetical protein
MTVRLDQSPTFSAHSAELHFLIRNIILVVEDAIDQMRIRATSLMLALLRDLSQPNNMAAGGVFVTDKSDSHSMIEEILGTLAGELTSAAVVRWS